MLSAATCVGDHFVANRLALPEFTAPVAVSSSGNGTANPSPAMLRGPYRTLVVQNDEDIMATKRILAEV